MVNEAPAGSPARVPRAQVRRLRAALQMCIRDSYYTPYHRWRMEAMIQRSDNRATNYFIELLNRTSRRSGPAEAQHTLKRRNPGIFRQTRIVGRIPSGGRSYRNKASALDYSRFLQALWHDRLPYSGEIKLSLIHI